MLTRKRVAEFLHRLQGRRVAVIGDMILDRYIHGSASRISPEAPVPVVRVHQRRVALGGAANVLRNLRALGVGGCAYGLVGDDEAGRELVQRCCEDGIETSGLLIDPNRPTTVKTRVIAEQQQVVRIDEEEDGCVDEAIRQQLIDSLADRLAAGEIDAIIFEDYNKGVIDEQLAIRLQELADRHEVLTALDPHPGNQMKIPGLTLMTPNRSEAFALTGAYYRSTVLPVTEDTPLLAVGSDLLQSWQAQMLLITLGAAGMTLFQRDEPVHHEPTVAREVFDVSGAGDTVIAAFCTGLLGGLSPHEAMVFANHAGGVVVGRVGTVPVDRAALIASFPEEAP